ncbi:unnamed protein product [Auanema sp. JU1783]|nr:unnamed protein product [Auanema sp. JU1783]
MEPFPCGDRRLPHHVFPPKKISPDQLMSLAGVQYYKVDLEDTVQMKKRISRVKTEKNVNASDMFVINDSVPDLNDRLEEYYEPAVKSDDVVSLVLDGACYYDVEPEEDEWIRVQMEKGDLLVIPKGLSHRFTVTPQNNVTIQRFFSKKPDSVQG